MNYISYLFEVFLPTHCRLIEVNFQMDKFENCWRCKKSYPGISRSMAKATYPFKISSHYIIAMLWSNGLQKNIDDPIDSSSGITHSDLEWMS